MTKEIDWTSPVVGKLEVGKTYVDRTGRAHKVAGNSSCDFPFVSEFLSYTSRGAFSFGDEVRHTNDLIGEYQPPAPLRMWMNVNSVDCRRFFTSKDNAIHAAIYTVDLVRTAVPVEVTEITEGH